APANSNDSGTSGMQHMAVVRDFDIPSETTASVHVDSPNGGEELAIGGVHAIRWTSSGASTVDIDYAADGTSFTRVATAVPASAGTFAWTVPAPATTSGLVRITAGSATDSSDGSFTTAGTTDPGQVILNEVLANELGTATSGEFIELVNLGGSDVDVSGWTLADSVSTRHVFAAGTTIGPGARLVVSGNTATTGALGLSNAGDTVTLANGGTAVDSFTFGGSPDGVSFNRSPDATTGSFVLHTALSTALSSPGGAP
ncbi:MAG TPA: lamin tail domain-containing protein, partial [Kofleriaceae bacterium]